MAERYSRELVDKNLRKTYDTGIIRGRGREIGKDYVNIEGKKIPIKIRHGIISENALRETSRDISEVVKETPEKVYRSLSKKPDFYSIRNIKETLQLPISRNLKEMRMSSAITLIVFSVGLISLISFKTNLITGFTISDTLNKSPFFLIFLGVCIGFLIVRKYFFKTK